MKKKRPAVLHFIDEERQKGATDQQIRHSLLEAGWHMDIIHHAMHSGEDQTAHKKVGKDQKPVWMRINPIILLVFGLVIILLLALFA